MKVFVNTYIILGFFFSDHFLNANLINLIIFEYEQHLTLITDNSTTASEPYKGFIPTLGNR